jgi:hypothetical protein
VKGFPLLLVIFDIIDEGLFNSENPEKGIHGFITKFRIRIIEAISVLVDLIQAHRNKVILVNLCLDVPAIRYELI